MKSHERLKMQPELALAYHSLMSFNLVKPARTGANPKGNTVLPQVCRKKSDKKK